MKINILIRFRIIIHDDVLNKVTNTYHFINLNFFVLYNRSNNSIKKNLKFLINK